jgi:hypothetical protein
MEHELSYERHPNQLMDAWDAVPRDGPALFIARLDAGRPTAGTWVRTDQPERFTADELASLLGEPLATRQQREWVVLDQIGLDEPMLPETLNLSGLQQLLRRRAEART